MNDINAIYLKVVGDALSDLAEDPSLTLSMAINNGLDDIQGLSGGGRGGLPTRYLRDTAEDLIPRCL